MRTISMSKNSKDSTRLSFTMATLKLCVALSTDPAGKVTEEVERVKSPGVAVPRRTDVRLMVTASCKAVPAVMRRSTVPVWMPAFSEVPAVPGLKVM